MIIVPDDAPAKLRDPATGYEAMEGLPRSGDFLVWTRDSFEKRLHLKASLPATIVREGKLLYAAWPSNLQQAVEKGSRRIWVGGIAHSARHTTYWTWPTCVSRSIRS